MNSSKTWYLGSMNDGLFIIDAPPSPSGTDVPPGDYGRGPSMVLNVTDLPHAKAKAIVDAHNAALTAAPASAAEPVGWQVQFDDGNWSNALYSEAEVKEFKASPRGTVAAYRPVYDHPPITIDT